jgi:hypothetical protein
MKRMALDAIHNDLVCTFGKDVVASSTVTKYVPSAQFSGRKEATLPEAPNMERSPVDEAILTALAEFPFPFRLCASFRGGYVFRDPPCTRTRISRNHFGSRCDIFDGSHTFDGGIEADSGTDGNQTIADPLSAEHAPVARRCHLVPGVDLFVQ